jgi:hypothetical protein
MALKGSFNFNGVALPSAYAVLLNANGGKAGWFAQLAVYATQPSAADQQGGPEATPPLRMVSVYVPYARGSDPVLSLYAQALQLPEFAAMTSDEPVTILTRREFLNRFYVAERISIRNGAKGGDVIAEDFLHLLDDGENVELDNPDTIAGVNYCASKGYITTDRATAILTA